MKKSDIKTFCINPGNDKLIWGSKFITQNRYLPILKLTSLIDKNPLILAGNNYSNSKSNNIPSIFYPYHNGNIYTVYNQTKRFGVYTGFYSVIIVKNQKNSNYNYVIDCNKVKELYKTDAEYDILVLGTVDVNCYKKFVAKNSSTFQLNKKRVTLLVSEKVWKNDAYCSQHYIRSLRKHIKNFIKLSTEQGMIVKIVPHDYLNQFIDSKNPRLKATSLTTIKEIECDVKEALFSNPNTITDFGWK